MGGGSYSRDVGYSSSSDGFSSGDTSSDDAKSALDRSSMDSSISPKNRTIKSEKKSPIIIVLDVTGSNIEFARIVYDKAPMLFGQIEQQGYLKDFDICFIATGDANCDSAPLQVCDFESGIALDEQLKKLFLEGYGGGQRMETYELVVHFLNKHCKMPNAKTPMLFIIGDEAPYPELEPQMTEEILGKSTGKTIKTKEIFKEMFKKFKGNAFFLQNPYCGETRPDKHTDEIRQEWINYMGTANSEKIIPIHEEKSVVDVILGTIAMVSKTKDMNGYISDMEDRGQTKTRIGNVKKSLKGIETQIDVNFPKDNLKLKTRTSKLKQVQTGKTVKGRRL